MSTKSLNITDLMQDQPGQWLLERHIDGSLKKHWPFVDKLFGVPQRPEWHPEVDTGAHIVLCLDQAAKFNANLDVRYAVLVHDLGKGDTRKCDLPRHPGHENRGVPMVREMNAMIGSEYQRAQKLGVLVCKHHLLAHTAFDLTAKKLFGLFYLSGMIEDKSLAEDFILACEMDKRGRLGRDHLPYPQGEFLKDIQGVFAANYKFLKSLLDSPSQKEQQRAYRLIAGIVEERKAKYA
jgi:tRNA nucleotidyltransferase (CCA-adding enzyme)